MARWYKPRRRGYRSYGRRSGGTTVVKVSAPRRRKNKTLNTVLTVAAVGAVAFLGWKFLKKKQA